MTTSQYYIDRGEEGQARLRELAQRLDAHSIERLERISVAPGWRVLDLGAGGGTMSDWFCRRVGPTGHVVAIDLDTQNLERLAHANLEVRKADIVTHDLERERFDLAFARVVLMHIPEREAVLDKLVAALRPGGWLYVMDADQRREAADDGTPPELAAQFDWLRGWRQEARRRAGVDGTLGLRHPRSLHARGLVDIAVEGVQLFMFGGAASYHRRNDDAYLRPLARSGVLDEAELDRALAVYDDPRLGVWGPLGVHTWGRKPAAANPEAR